jgi:hypothetical protein
MKNIPFYSVNKLTQLIKLDQNETECLLFSKNRVEYQFLKLECAESSFVKIRGCQYNLS